MAAAPDALRRSDVGSQGVGRARANFGRLRGPPSCMEVAGAQHRTETPPRRGFLGTRGVRSTTSDALYHASRPPFGKARSAKIVSTCACPRAGFFDLGRLPPTSAAVPTRASAASRRRTSRAWSPWGSRSSKKQCSFESLWRSTRFREGAVHALLCLVSGGFHPRPRDRAPLAGFCNRSIDPRA